MVDDVSSVFLVLHLVSPFFFFQAEDGIRDPLVTGVQTCALPILPGALDGLRVLEVGDLVSAAYATKLLADLGADVVKVEARRGDLARGRGPFPRNTPHSDASGL